MTDHATCIACLTPPGRGAIATLGVQGQTAWSILRQLFRPLGSGNALPDSPEVGRIWLGRVGASGESDTVVLSTRRLRPVPWLELHGHGGTEIVRLIVEMFVGRGASECAWEDFLRRTGDEPSRVEAQIQLARAPTARTASILLDQVHGALAGAMESIRAALRAGAGGRALQRLEDLLRHEGLSRHLTEPWRVVIAGAANVGKSSLVNALAGYERAVVSPIPGTTRDVVATLLAIDGWPVEVTDTAGWRTQATPLEQAGMALARAAAAAADLCLWLLDASAMPEFPVETACRLQYVINKIDLPPAWEHASVPGAIRVSAKTGAGMDRLCDFISRSLVPAPPPPGSAAPFTPTIVERLRQAHRQCEREHWPAALALMEQESPT